MTLEFRNEDGGTVQKSLADLERIFERFRTALPIEKMPKKKFLVAEQKLMEKRKNWAEALVSHLVAKHPDKLGQIHGHRIYWLVLNSSEVQSLFGGLLRPTDENHVNLGPSEKRMLVEKLAKKKKKKISTVSFQGKAEPF